MIAFRAIEKEDLEMLGNWRNSESVRSCVREYRLLSTNDQEMWYEHYQKTRRDSDWGQELMIMLKDGNSIGAGGFTRIQWRNQKAELSFYIGVDGERNALTIPEALRTLVRKGFHEFNFHKITWPVYGHDPNLDQYQKVFKTEAVLKEEYFWDGKFQDRHYLSLLRKEFDRSY